MQVDIVESLMGKFIFGPFKYDMYCVGACPEDRIVLDDLKAGI
ncbi:unnamed protein product [marine sediment metagenome]|uniref:Uncharacterized protein n=1 Tax=marine sediment metagenome TaxID=412755 RepID=X0VLW6_9ZZZZ